MLTSTTSYDDVSRRVYFNWFNETTGINSSANVLVTDSGYYDGSRVDYIDEKFGGYDLMKYGSIGRKGATAGWRGGSNFAGNLGHFFYRTVNATLDQNLDYGLQTSSAWNDYWHGCR